MRILLQQVTEGQLIKKVQAERTPSKLLCNNPGQRSQQRFLPVAMRREVSFRLFRGLGLHICGYLHFEHMQKNLRSRVEFDVVSIRDDHRSRRAGTRLGIQT
jgi:hypothetical protein